MGERMTDVTRMVAIYAACLQPCADRLEPQLLIGRAEAATGLCDWGGDRFGESGFRHRLDLLSQSLENEAALSAVGRSRAHSRIHVNLCSRLAVIDWHRSHPGQANIADPLIGTGLARAGTSFFHQLLAQDDENMAAPMAECMIPVPPPGDATFDAARFDLIGRIQDFHGLRTPGIEAVHPFTPENAAECLALQAGAIGTEPQAFFSIPTFMAQAAADMPELLKWEQAVMQVLQSGMTGSRWLLKTPQHLGFWEQMLGAFPGARVFINHRDPAKTVPSILSLFGAFHRENTTRKVEPKLMARAMVARMNSIQNVSRWRKAHPSFRIVDIHYLDMVADPIGQTERVYEAFGLHLGAQARDRMEGFLKTNRHAHGPKHSYSLEDFGLSEADIEDVFGEYIDEYAIARER